MKRHYRIGIVLTGLVLIMTGGIALAATQAVLPTGSSSHPGTSQPAVTRSTPLPPSGQAGVQPAVTDDIRDIRGPLHIPAPLVWLYYAGGACLFLMAAAGVWRWLRRHKALRAKRAFEIAFEQLEHAKALMKPELADAFSVAVSDAIRTYIENRFEVRVTRHTTEEFMARIGADPAGDLVEYSDLLQHFLGYCDLAKFARYLLTVDQMKEMHQSAWQFVDRTKPLPEENTADQKSEIGQEGSTESEKPKRASLFSALRAKGLTLIPKKTMADGGLDTRSAVAAGGR